MRGHGDADGRVTPVGRTATSSDTALTWRPGGSRDRARNATDGFTLVELMFVVAIVGVLAVLASGQYSKYVDNAKVANARADILVMSLEIQRFRNNSSTAELPASLADIGRGQQLDPWNNAYHYTALNGGNKGKARKDHKLNPLNSDFDLFSAGKNGVFKTQITQKDSVDDVIRARDGSFVDLAEKF